MHWGAEDMGGPLASLSFLREEIKQIHTQSQEKKSWFHILIKTPVISWQMSVYLFRNYINMYFKWPNRQIFKNKLNSHYTLVEAS